MTIVTKRGDGGTTSICHGTIGKDAKIIQALGSLDETNSFLGLAICFIPDKKIKENLKKIQKDLLLIGSIVFGAKLIFPSENLIRIEDSIQSLEKKLPTLKHFILPGGLKSASFLHVSRVSVRKAERDLVSLKRKKKVDKVVLAYTNRLSDYLFLLARFLNVRAKIPER